MLSISKPFKATAKAVAYYVEYYTTKHEGVWFGEGAERLSIAGKVTPEQFESLLLGRHPDGTPLVQIQNWKNRERQAGWDLTFSAPKSVSVLWALDETLRQGI